MVGVKSVCLSFLSITIFRHNLKGVNDEWRGFGEEFQNLAPWQTEAVATSGGGLNLAMLKSPELEQCNHPVMELVFWKEE